MNRFVGYLIILVTCPLVSPASSNCKDIGAEELEYKANNQYASFFIDNQVQMRIGTGTNGSVYQYKEHPEFVLKTYTSKNPKDGKEGYHQQSESENLRADMVRFSFYKAVVAKNKIDLLFPTIYAAKKNKLLYEFINGVPVVDKAGNIFWYSPLKNYSPSLIVSYNNVILDLITATLKDSRALTVNRLRVTSSLEQPVFQKIYESESLEKTREILQSLKNYPHPLAFSLDVQSTLGTNFYLTFLPTNFIYDIKREKFVMVDPI